MHPRLLTIPIPEFQLFGREFGPIPLHTYGVLLAIAIVTVLGPGLINALLAIGIVSIPAYARVVRASVLSVREMDYVSATRAL